MKRLIIDLPPTQRRWRDLSKPRLFLSLALAPVAPVFAGLFLIFGLLGGPSGQLDMVETITGSAVAWSLVLGSAYFLIVVRWRGVVGRIECFLLGIVAASTLPIVASYLMGEGLFAVDPFEPGDDGAAIVVILAIMLMPFGLLGGWVFWRAGIHPTVTTAVDLAPVFD